MRFCSIGGSSSKPPRLAGSGCWSVRFSRNCSQSISPTCLASVCLVRPRLVALALLQAVDAELALLVGLVDGVHGVVAGRARPGLEVLVGQDGVGVAAPYGFRR